MKKKPSSMAKWLMDNDIASSRSWANAILLLFAILNLTMATLTFTKLYAKAPDIASRLEGARYDQTQNIPQN